MCPGGETRTTRKDGRKSPPCKCGRAALNHAPFFAVQNARPPALPQLPAGDQRAVAGPARLALPAAVGGLPRSKWQTVVDVGYRSSQVYISLLLCGWLYFAAVCTTAALPPWPDPLRRQTPTGRAEDVSEEGSSPSRRSSFALDRSGGATQSAGPQGGEEGAELAAELGEYFCL